MQEEQPYTGFIINECSASREVESYYNQAPDIVKRKFNALEFKLAVSKNLNQKYGISYSIMAITDYNTKTIYIEYSQGNQSSVIHELGHFVDWYSSGSSTQEFCDIYNSELNIFRSIHNTSIQNTNTTKEFFAEAFQEVVWHPIVQSNCPLTYNYILSRVYLQF